MDAVRAGAIVCALILSEWAIGLSGVGAGSTARITPSGDGIELEYRNDTGTSTDMIPLYQSNGVRYFSAGVGIEEREAEYPAFPLKIVFTAGGKPYLTGVTVRITDAKGTVLVTIPKEQITGPWLFLDLPPGTYHIAATSDDVTQGLKGVTVRLGAVKVVHLRWPEPRNQ